MDQLSGKVAFITGSAGGIGLGIARACAEAGMKIALADVDEQLLEQTARELSADGAEVIPVPLDVTDRDGWHRAASDVPAQLGPVQLLVNNAGVSTFGMSFGDVEPELWDRVIAINLTGVYNGLYHFLPGMKAVGDGHVVNTSSAAGLGGVPKNAPYSATKFAVMGLSESLRAELSGSGVGVSILCPGSVRTRLWRTSRAARGLPDIDVPPPELLVGGSADPNGMDPYEVGLRVVDAVVSDHPYIMTHPELRAFAAGRNDVLIQGFDRAAEFGSHMRKTP
jgi:NAD(P)-dependent dehydrogenase (short-subunit alcohol dehydrogenase family)